MPLYLSKFSYTPETWARLIRNPDDRRKAAQLYIESAGGKLTDSSMPLALMTATIYGKPQTTYLWPRLRWRLVAVAGLARSRRQVLLSVDETMDALRKAGQIQYRAPGA
jgi:hypothetical protein